jgi:hypothetical protein
LLGEFERFEPTRAKLKMLRQKAENLVMAHHAVGGSARLLVLAAWTTSAVPVRGLQRLRTDVRNGFLDEDGNWVPPLPAGAEMLTPVFVMHSTGNNLVLREVLL